MRTTGKPVELLPRSPKVVQKQIAMLKADFSEYTLEAVGQGLQSRVRILPFVSPEKLQSVKGLT